MTDRMESGTPGDNSADPTKDPKTADGSQDCSCAEARAHLEAFLDRECTADLAERLAQHVATCSHCSRLADAEQAPPELRARVLGRLSALRATAVSVTTTSTTTRTRPPPPGGSCASWSPGSSPPGPSASSTTEGAAGPRL